MKVKTYYSLDDNARLDVIDLTGYEYEGNPVVQFGFIQTFTKGNKRESSNYTRSAKKEIKTTSEVYSGSNML